MSHPRNTRPRFGLLTVLALSVAPACTTDTDDSTVPAFFNGIVASAAGRTLGDDAWVIDSAWGRAVTLDTATGGVYAKNLEAAGIAPDRIVRSEIYGWPVTGAGYLLTDTTARGGRGRISALRTLSPTGIGEAIAESDGGIDIFGGELTAAAVISAETVLLLQYDTGVTEVVPAPPAVTSVVRWLGYDEPSRVLYGSAASGDAYSLTAWSLAATAVTEVAALPFLPDYADFDGSRFVLASGQRVAVVALGRAGATGRPRAAAAITEAELFFAPVRVVAAPGNLAIFQAPDGTLHRATASSTAICLLHREAPTASDSAFLDVQPISIPKLTVHRVGEANCPTAVPSQAWIASYEIPPAAWRSIAVTEPTDRLDLAGATFAATGDTLLSSTGATAATVVASDVTAVHLDRTVSAGEYSLRPNGRWTLTGSLSGLVGTFPTGVSTDTGALRIEIADGADPTSRGDTFSFSTDVPLSGYTPLSTVSSIQINPRSNLIVVTDRISGAVDALELDTLTRKWRKY